MQKKEDGVHSCYLADGELRVIGFSHGVINKGCHQLSDLVQIIGPSFLMDERAKINNKNHTSDCDGSFQTLFSSPRAV